jgi:hypothetical protein
MHLCKQHGISGSTFFRKNEHYTNIMNYYKEITNFARKLFFKKYFAATTG